jgi:hypothetical protein
MTVLKAVIIGRRDFQSFKRTIRFSKKEEENAVGVDN